MKKEKTRPVPAIVEFFTFWFGRDWRGIQTQFSLTDEQIQRLKKENQAFRGIQP